MENPKLIKSLLFLEDCLNNKLAVTECSDYRAFLDSLARAISDGQLRIVIKAKSLGEKCCCCQRYIHLSILPDAIRVENNRFVCSIMCNRLLKNSQQKWNKRKGTDESSTSSVAEEEYLQTSVRNCRCNIV